MKIINEFIDWNLCTGYFDNARLHIKKQTNSNLCSSTYVKTQQTKTLQTMNTG